MVTRSIGEGLPRVDGVEKVTGTARYTNDFTLPRMLFGKILRSPYPHARIANIDTTAAKQLPGVKAVLTGRDAPEARMGLILDRPLLAVDEVRFVGEAVAAVAAETPEIAEEALDLIEADYEELPAIFDPEEAMKPGAMAVQPGHQQLPTIPAYAGHVHIFKAEADLANIYRHFEVSEGDIARGFLESDFVIENRYDVPRMAHCAMEPHCGLARMEPDGGFTVWVNDQHPYEVQGFLSRIFGLPKAKVRIITPYIGGGFGGKLFVMGAPWAMLLARATGRPVKVLYSREEVFVDGLTDVPIVLYIKDGVRKDGTLHARHIRAILNCGAYSGRVLLVTGSIALGIVNYRIPNFRMDTYCVATNEPVSGPFRGFGGVPLIFAVESQMAILAEAIGMDPVQFLHKNMHKEGEVNLLGQIAESIEIEECLDKAANWIDWGKPLKREDGPWRMGRGVASQGKGGLVTPYSCVAVKVFPDGIIEIRHSATEVGQGTQTVLAQLAAEEFGISIEKVRQVSADTAVTPYDITSTGNITTFSTGNAVVGACRDAKRQIFDLAAKRLEVGAGALELRDGQIYVKGKAEPAMKIGELFVPGGGGLALTGELIGEFAYMGRELSKEERERMSKKLGIDYMYCYGACGAEVAVNTETGEVKILRLSQCHDMGRALNPKTCEAQIDGGTGMGVGRTLYENMVLENGVVVNPNFVDYKVPTMIDVPTGDTTVSMMPVGIPQRDGPYGGKGFGESTNCDVAPALANAIHDAVGIRIKELPITREKVLEGLKALHEERRR